MTADEARLIIRLAADLERLWLIHARHCERHGEVMDVPYPDTLDEARAAHKAAEEALWLAGHEQKAASDKYRTCPECSGLGSIMKAAT